jgi:hypothetical protein
MEVKYLIGPPISKLASLWLPLPADTYNSYTAKKRFQWLAKLELEQHVEFDAVNAVLINM